MTTSRMMMTAITTDMARNRPRRIRSLRLTLGCEKNSNITAIVLEYDVFIMSRKTLIYAGLILGSTIGGFFPALWGAGAFSFSGVILSALGGIAGIYLGFKLGS